MTHQRRFAGAVSPRRTRLAPDSCTVALINFHCMKSRPAMRCRNRALQYLRLHVCYLLLFGTCGRRRCHMSRALARASFAVTSCRAATVATCTARTKPTVTARRTLTGTK